MSERHATRVRMTWTPCTVVGLAALAGLLARVWTVLLAPAPHFAADDLFDRLAWNLVSHRTFTLDGVNPAAHVGPLYPAVLACFYAILGHRPEWVPALHIVFDLTASFCLYRVGTLLWGSWVGVWTAALFLLYPAYWTYDPRIRSEALLTLLSCGWVWASVACAHTPATWRYVMLGLLAGLTILCKPVVLVLACLLAGLAWVGAVPLSRKVAYAALYLATSLAMVAPWSVRNYVAFHDVIPVSAGIGAGLWMGSDPVSRGSWPMPAERERALWDSAGITPLPYAHAMYDVATDRLLREKGWARIKSDPAAYIGLSMARVWDFWIGNSFYVENGQGGIVSGLWQDAAERGWLVAAYSLTKRLILVPTMMAAALWSAWCFRERWRELLPLYAFPVGLTLGYVPFTVEAGRYALPVLPCLMVLSVAWATRALTTRSFLSSGRPASARQPVDRGAEAVKPTVLAELAGSAGYGGGERYLELLFDRLDRTRFHPILICPESGPFADKMAARGVSTRILTLDPLFSPAALVRLVHFLKREEVAILQTHGARANFYGRLAGRLAGVPCVVSTVHNSIDDYEVGRVTRWLYKAMLRVTVPLADRIICVSEAIKQDLLDDCPAAAPRAVTVYNGVDAASFDGRGDGQRIRREWCLGDGPVLLTVARLTEQKGHRFLIEALPGLLSDWPTLCCVFVGEGESRESLRRMARETGVAQSCRFAGARDDVVDWYAAADVVVLPSLSEGFPFVVLEALAMFKPVVATKVNGVPEIIEDGRTGLLVPPRDPQALERAIRRILHDPESAARMGRAGHARVAARLTAGRMVQDTTAVFESALASEDRSATVPGREAA